MIADHPADFQMLVRYNTGRKREGLPKKFTPFPPKLVRMVLMYPLLPRRFSMTLDTTIQERKFGKVRMVCSTRL